MKGGCSCGAKTWDSEPLRGLASYEVPVCPNPKCGKHPEVFVIVATVEDADGLKKRIKIRHTQEGIRLKDVVDVVYTLRTVNREIDSQTFDVRRYESQESRESFKFDKVIEAYLSYHEKRLLRGEISPAGLKDKKTLINNHLSPIFKSIDVALISDRRIRDFYNSYTDSLRMRDKATAELKTILYFAMDEGKIPKLPKFPEISASKMVSSDKFLDPKKQDVVISNIENELYRAVIKTLAIYGLRPCEVRSLKWADINFQEEVFHVRSHLSLSQDIPGRKSQSDKVHTLPITEAFSKILKSLPRSINLNDYVFKGSHGGPIGQNVLTRAWNEACKKSKIKDVTLYQGTKHSTLSNLSKKASDAQLIKLSGHTNTRIIRRYAQSNIDEVRELLQ
jgi:integrase